MSKRLRFSHFTPRRPLALSGQVMQVMTAVLAERLFFGWPFLGPTSYCGFPCPAPSAPCGSKVVPPFLVLGYSHARARLRRCRKRLPETRETPETVKKRQRSQALEPRGRALTAPQSKTTPVIPG